MEHPAPAVDCLGRLALSSARSYLKLCALQRRPRRWRSGPAFVTSLVCVPLFLHSINPQPAPTRCCSVMPEALEKWPVRVIGKLLPRHMQLIEQINTQWLASIKVGRQAAGHGWLARGVSAGGQAGVGARPCAHA